MKLARLKREKEEWEDTIKRYREIRDALVEVRDSLWMGGNPKIKVRPCIFCKRYPGCANCGYRKHINDCHDDGSNWERTRAKFIDLQAHLNNEILEYRNQLREVEKEIKEIKEMEKIQRRTVEDVYKVELTW